MAKANATATTSSSDIYERITQRIIEQLEAGERVLRGAGTCQLRKLLGSLKQRRRRSVSQRNVPFLRFQEPCAARPTFSLSALPGRCRTSLAHSLLNALELLRRSLSAAPLHGNGGSGAGLPATTRCPIRCLGECITSPYLCVHVVIFDNRRGPLHQAVYVHVLFVARLGKQPERTTLVDCCSHARILWVAMGCCQDTIRET